MSFDVSLLSLEVVATNGDTHLCGQDFDERVMNHFIKVFKHKNKLDIRNNDRALAKLHREVEKTKRALSSTTQVRIEIENFADGKDFSETLMRARFEEPNNELFRQTLKPLEVVIKDAGMKKGDIHEFVLVGGSTKIQELSRGINPDEAVAYGAAVQAAILGGDTSDETAGILLVDVTPLSLGIETDRE